MRIKWKNIPIPEGYLLGILAGIVIHFFTRKIIFPPMLVGHLVGWPLIVTGAGICCWAVAAADAEDLSSPQKLVTRGPYAYSRNPMYVGWALICLGIACVVNSIWIMIIFPGAGVYHHFVDVRKEETFLEQRFGARYREYRKNVRRYL